VVSARSAYSGCFRFSPRYHDIFNPRPRDCELAHRDKNFFVADCFKLRFAGRLRVWLPEILSNGPLVLCDPVKFRLLKRGPRSDRPTPISLSCAICNGVLVDNCRAVCRAGGHRFARDSRRRARLALSAGYSRLLPLGLIVGIFYQPFRQQRSL
jgi:hypothetical protein